MPASPQILGESPRTLARTLRPSQVFTGLILLRADPHAAARVLRRGIPDRQRTHERAWAPEPRVEPAAIGLRAGGRYVRAVGALYAPVARGAAAIASIATAALTATGTIAARVAVVVIAALLGVEFLLRGRERERV